MTKPEEKLMRALEEWFDARNELKRTGARKSKPDHLEENDDQYAARKNYVKKLAAAHAALEFWKKQGTS